MPSTLQHECHLHLYGCLPAKDFWNVAEARSKTHAARYQWYLAEFERLTGIRLDSISWWNPSDGFTRFKQAYLCDKPVSFDLFQAKFNLLIALFPPSPGDMWLPESVFKMHEQEGGYKEYRTFLPLYLPDNERTQYLRRILELVRDFQSKSYQPRIAISLMRSDREAWAGYQFLRQFLSQHPDLAPFVTGIDFCASERGHPPKSKRLFFEKLLEDSKTDHPLSILYHVGEMWQDISIASAARWCVEAAVMGVDRLGHALALGMNVEALKGGRIIENIAELGDHFEWIRLNMSELQSFGFGPSDYQWALDRAESSREGANVEWFYDDDLIQHTMKFQDAAMAMIAKRKPVIECCPTSNMRIGQLKTPAQHPIGRFLNHNLNVTVSTDDPGIFDITLESEEQLLRREFKLTDKIIHQLNETAAHVLS